MKFSDAANYLIERKYIVNIRGKLTLTNKFYRDLENPPTEDDLQPSTLVIAQPLTTKELYKKFIEDAEVPAYIALSNGSRFAANRYSVDGERVFTKILKSRKIDMDILLAATKQYYKPQNSARQMITNYFVKGTWESVYEEHLKIKDSTSTIVDDGESKYDQRI